MYLHISTHLTLLAFSLFLLPLLASGHKINSESPRDISIQLCTHERRHEKKQMQYFPDPVKYCVSVRSNKHKKDRDEQSTTTLRSRVAVSWRRVGAAKGCEMEFKGYQHEYRLSPDFGAYPTCQHDMARHLYALSEEMSRSGYHGSRLPFNSTVKECPIRAMPQTYAEYVTCTLQPDEWYVLEWSSSIFYETFHNRSYGSFWANHTTAFLFQPNDHLRRNGTESEWLGRLLNVETRSEDCESASVLLRVDAAWPTHPNVTLTYRVRDGNRKPTTLLLGSWVVNRWQQVRFALDPTIGSHEVCAHMTYSSIPVRHKVCRRVVDRSECPFVAASNTVPFFYSFSSFAILIFTFFVMY